MEIGWICSFKRFRSIFPSPELLLIQKIERDELEHRIFHFCWTKKGPPAILAAKKRSDLIWMGWDFVRPERPSKQTPLNWGLVEVWTPKNIPKLYRLKHLAKGGITWMSKKAEVFDMKFNSVSGFYRPFRCDFCGTFSARKHVEAFNVHKPPFFLLNKKTVAMGWLYPSRPFKC